jgi:hypothetical protein
MSDLNKIAISVAPTPIILPPKYITSYSYNIVTFELFSKIIFECQLFDSDSNLLDKRTVIIEGSDYQNWGNDDSYIINTLSNKLGLSPYPPIVKPPLKYFQSGYDLSGNLLKFTNLTVDSSGNIILPDGFKRDPNTNAILDNLNNPIEYKFLRYDVDGNPLVFQTIILDQSNNPILPVGYIIDNNNYVRDSNGVHIVIVI